MMMMMMMCCWDPFVGVGANESGPPSMFRAGSLVGLTFYPSWPSCAGWRRSLRDFSVLLVMMTMVGFQLCDVILSSTSDF